MRQIRELGPRDVPGLLDLPEPPEHVFVVGDVPRGPRVAIVGTRRATPEGARFARELSADLAGRGVAIVSGGARGIDVATHHGAIEVGGVTVVVGPSSFDRPFPAEHRALFERVVDTGGAYLSRYSSGVEPRRAQFFARNELLVALAHVVVVVESGARGGARNTAKWARRLGRPLLVVPGSPWCPAALGCLAELRAGAELLVSSRDVLRKLAALGLHAVPPGPPGDLPLFRAAAPDAERPDLPMDSNVLPGRERLLACLGREALHPDEICARTRLSIGQVQELLLTLTLEGALATLPAGKVRLVSSGND